MVLALRPSPTRVLVWSTAKVRRGVAKPRRGHPASRLATASTADVKHGRGRAEAACNFSFRFPISPFRAAWNVENTNTGARAAGRMVAGGRVRLAEDVDGPGHTNFTERRRLLARHRRCVVFLLSRLGAALVKVHVGARRRLRLRIRSRPPRTDRRTPGRPTLLEARPQRTHAVLARVPVGPGPCLVIVMGAEVRAMGASCGREVRREVAICRRATLFASSKEEGAAGPDRGGDEQPEGGWTEIRQACRFLGPRWTGRMPRGERVRPLSGGTRDSAEEPEARIMSVKAGTRELRRPQSCLATWGHDTHNTRLQSPRVARRWP